MNDTWDYRCSQPIYLGFLRGADYVKRLNLPIKHKVNGESITISDEDYLYENNKIVVYKKNKDISEQVMAQLDSQSEEGQHVVIVDVDPEDKAMSGVQSDVLNACARNYLDYTYICEITLELDVKDQHVAIMCFTKANIKCYFENDLRDKKDSMVGFAETLPNQHVAFFILDKRSNFLTEQ